MKKSTYREVETIRDADGLVLTITEREHTGHFSFLIQKEFAVGDEVKTTAWLGVRHIPGAKRLLRQAEARIGSLQDRKALDQLAR